MLPMRTGEKKGGSSYNVLCVMLDLTCHPRLQCLPSPRVIRWSALSWMHPPDCEFYRGCRKPSTGMSIYRSSLLCADERTGDYMTLSSIPCRASRANRSRTLLR